jgi:hypothetical protein
MAVTAGRSSSQEDFESHRPSHEIPGQRDSLKEHHVQREETHLVRSKVPARKRPIESCSDPFFVPLVPNSCWKKKLYCIASSSIIYFH